MKRIICAVLPLFLIVSACTSRSAHVKTRTKSPTAKTSTAPSPSPIVKPTDPSVFFYPVEPWDKESPLNLLFLGSDGRNNDTGECFEPVEARDSAGNVTAIRQAIRGRADSIHLVIVDPKKRLASVINIPRDSWVPIDGVGVSKMNAAFYFDKTAYTAGPRLMLKTFRVFANNIPVHYIALTTFCGFLALVNAVEYVTVDVPYDIRDEYGQFRLCPEVQLQKGPQRLNACQSLFLSRTRHYLKQGDINRTQHQGLVLLAALQRLQELAGGGPKGWFRITELMRAHIKLGPNLAPRGEVSWQEVFSLAKLILSLDPQHAVNCTLPGRHKRVGEAMTVQISAETLKIFDDIKDGVLDMPSRCFQEI